MQMLNPTLWRTCKMLAGKTRIRLLRQLHAHPGEGVKALGKRVGIGHAAASQELRRIQSRGLLQVERHKSFKLYRMVSDPQVTTAAPLLKAMQTVFDQLPPEKDERVCVIAAGLSHERRVQIVQSLLRKPQSLSELQFVSHISPHPFREHMKTLLASQFVVLSQDQAHFAVPDHPLGITLAKLLHGRAR
jgi:predicted ArsR family transcriptional regulator